MAKIELRHESVILCRNGKPVAELLPWKKPAEPLHQSARLKKVVFHESPSLPLAENDWPKKYR
jgi:antitoxin (DNA-binding transcriptional repressor) of toxin-antitoxin stability system